MILNAESGCQAGKCLWKILEKINTRCLGQVDRKISIVVGDFSAASRTRMYDETTSKFIFGT